MLAAVIALAALPLPSAQESERTRKGFWFDGGPGWGTSDCEACDDGRVDGCAGVLAVGGTLSQKLLLGASSNAIGVDFDGEGTGFTQLGLSITVL